VEEVAYRMGFIDAAKLEILAGPMKKNGYGQYLIQLARENAPAPQ
jgi:glucose-1-phosphate thymidylyltransferase